MYDAGLYLYMNNAWMYDSEASVCMRLQIWADGWPKYITKRAKLDHRPEVTLRTHVPGGFSNVNRITGFREARIMVQTEENGKSPPKVFLFLIIHASVYSAAFSNGQEGYTHD
jgi:hypothetical protein